LKYKYCHLDIDSASRDTRLNSARRVYLRNWSQNAANLDRQGAYDWMAGRLAPYSPKRILDVGSGDGRGIEALWRRFQCNFLISIDENRECLSAAASRLKNVGACPEIVHRLDVEMRSDKHYFLETQTGKLPLNTGIFLVESDLLVDPELESYLAKVPPFDAVTVWLVGTHLMRQHCLNLAPLEIRASGEYRLRVQNKVYELADKVLKPGGVLQVVDRGEEPSSESVQRSTLEGHREQASVTSLEVGHLDFMPYSEVEAGRRVHMVETREKPVENRSVSQLAIVSVIATKPS
jgi:SAM-dependent methyltransferase